MNIRTDDTVVVISGSDKGRKGKVKEKTTDLLGLGFVQSKDTKKRTTLQQELSVTLQKPI